jgi:hypothetical protein
MRSKVAEQFVDAVTASLSDASDGDGGKKSGRIPRPAPDDKKSVQEYRNELHKKYPGLKDREDLPEYLTTTYENEDSTVKELVDKSGKISGVRPSVFYASSMEEGMRGLFPTSRNKGQIDYSDNEKFPISGFVNLGLDRFGENFSNLVKRGYLPADFQSSFQKSPEVNDKKEKVISANFKDLGSALQAKSAVIRAEEEDLNKWAVKNQISLTPKQKEFFTLVAYNAGAGNAQQMVESYNKKGFLKNDKFLEKQPDDSWSGPYQNVIKRINAANALESEGYF